MTLDPRLHAARRDLADVRLADRVFAPHYAAHVSLMLARPVSLMAERESGASPLAELKSGDMFEVLELAGGRAWGVAPGCGLVGYLDAEALADAAA